MPWPAFLLWGAAAALGALGVKKGYDAYSDNDKAKEIGEYAESKYEQAKTALENKRKETQCCLESLGKVKADVFSHQIKHLVDIQKKFHSKLSGFDEKIFIENMRDAEILVEKSLEVEKGVGTGAVSGALAALGAYGSVGAFATASTGTAIGSLSGVAATNATLAWLGGGSLAAGGFGITGGMVALGGIALAPLLAIGGFWAASRAEEALTKARKYEADVDIAIEKMEQVKSVMKAIRTAAGEQTAVIMAAIERFEKVKVYNTDDEEAFMRMFIIGKNLKQILDVPVLNRDGTANVHIRAQCEGFLQLS